MSAIKWKFDRDGNWGTAANWQPSHTPVSTDAVTIDTADFHTVTLSDGGSYTVRSLTVGNDLLSVSVGSLEVTGTASFANGLTVTGGTLQFDGDATVAGLFTASAGVIDGAGTLTLHDANFNDNFLDNTFSMDGTGATLLDGTTELRLGVGLLVDGGRVLENKAMFIQTGESEISVGVDWNNATTHAGKVQNDSGATMIFNSEGPSGSGGGVYGASAACQFINNGLVEITGPFDTVIDIDFTNNGMVQVRNSQLNIYDTGTSAVDHISLLSGAKLTIEGAPTAQSLGPLFTLTGGGALGSANSTIDLEGANLELTGATHVLSHLDFGGGLLTLDAGATINQFHGLSDFTIDNLSRLNLTAAVFSGNEELITGAGMTWLRGDTAMGANELALDGGQVLRNEGMMDARNDWDIELGYNPFGTAAGGGTLWNTASATILFDDQFQSSVAGNAGTTLFRNDGVVETTGAGLYIAANFENNGSVLVEANELEMRGAMFGHGTVTAAAGTTFLLEASGTAISNRVDVASGTGHVELTGGSAKDAFAFGGNFGASDKVDGGAGSDSLTLTGDYSGGLALGATTMVNVERLGFGDGFDYSVTSSDANVAAGATLIVDASALGAGHTLSFNGAAETDGHFVLASGLGGDNFTGGALADKFVYTTAAQSTSTGYDTINGFGFQQDRIDLHGLALPTAIDAALTGGTLDNGANFDSELAAALTGHLMAHGAMLFTADSGTLSGQTFLIVDLNGTAGYQSGGDLVVHMVETSGHLVVKDFV